MENYSSLNDPKLMRDLNTNLAAVDPAGWWTGNPSVVANHDGTVSFSFRNIFI